MNDLASLSPPAEGTARYLEQEVAEAVAIYSRLYPTQELDFLFYESRDPVWSAPSVIEGHVTYHPGLVTPEFLGRLRRPGAHPGAPRVTITLGIPRPPLPSELRQTDAPWRPQARLGALYALSPLTYETVRYLAEMRRRRIGERIHARTSLPRGEGSALFARGDEPTPGPRPAILVGMHWLEVGGAEKLAFDTIRWAHEAGLRVFVAASVPALQRLADRLPDSEDVTFLRLDRYLPHHLWPRYLEELARAENIRLVHIHHCRPLYDALPHLRVTCPWVQVIDSTHIVEYADGGYPRTSGVWSNFIDLHHVISGELVAYYRDNFHVLGKVRLGRMLERDELAAPPPVFRMQPGQSRLHVAFIGRLYYQKRPVVVVEALRALAAWADRTGVKLSASMVGEGPFSDAVRALLRRYGLADKVTQMPADSDVPALLGRSDILLVPSNNEGLALVCYEAVSQGAIPISTDVGSQDEIIPPDLLVPLAPRAAVRGIVAAVDRLWRDKDFMERQRAGLLARWQKIAADPTAREVLMPIYRQAAAGRSEG